MTEYNEIGRSDHNDRTNDLTRLLVLLPQRSSLYSFHRHACEASNSSNVSQPIFVSRLNLHAHPSVLSSIHPYSSTLTNRTPVLAAPPANNARYPFFARTVSPYFQGGVLCSHYHCKAGTHPSCRNIIDACPATYYYGCRLIAHTISRPSEAAKQFRFAQSASFTSQPALQLGATPRRKTIKEAAAWSTPPYTVSPPGKLYIT